MCCVCGSRPDRGGLCAVPSRPSRRGGVRAMPGGFPGTSHHAAQPARDPARGPRAIARPAFTPRARARASARTALAPVRHAIPPSPHGYATTNSLRPFGRLARRHHGVYHQGWYFPTTIGDDTGYIGRPYDPGEAIPVYGPAPIYDEPADPPAPRAAPASARVTEPGRREPRRLPRRDGDGAGQGRRARDQGGTLLGLNRA